MLSSFRRFSKSKGGTLILIAFGLLILASFALADISNVRLGDGSASSTTLASVGDEELTERDVTTVMERQLSRLRAQNPEAQMSDLLADFDAIVASLIEERAVIAWAEDNGLVLSKRLVDAEITRLPGVRGLDGRFSQQAYASFLQQQRLTDAEVRREIARSLIQRMVLAPVAGNSRIATGLAAPYASMLLEQRFGEVAFVPAERFRAGLNPSDPELAAFYARNQRRYAVPEQRVLRYALITPEQVAAVQASEQEIAAHYNANRASYAGGETRVISQAVVPDQRTAAAIAARANSGATMVDAVRPAGLGAEDISVGPQSRAEFTALAGDQVAAAAFAARPGQIVGPIQSPLGWHVVKIDSVRREPGRTLQQVRAEIAERLTAEKRKNALTDLVTAIEDEIADGASLSETAARHRLSLVETPPLTASGASLANPAYRLPAQAAGLVKGLFELSPDDDPVVEPLPGEAGYAVFAVGPVTASAAPPLAQLRERVRGDWIAERSAALAREAAGRIEARAGGNVALAEAARAAGVTGAEIRPLAGRRLDLARFQGQVPPPLRAMFGMAAGKAKSVAGPDGRGWFVVKVSRIVPGNASLQPGLIARTQAGFGQIAGEEYARQFVRALQAELGVRRNEQAIARVRRQLAGS